MLKFYYIVAKWDLAQEWRIGLTLEKQLMWFTITTMTK